jgi:hypothetical protein
MFSFADYLSAFRFVFHFLVVSIFSSERVVSESQFHRRTAEDEKTGTRFYIFPRRRNAFSVQLSF